MHICFDKETILSAHNCCASEYGYGVNSAAIAVFTCFCVECFALRVCSRVYTQERCCLHGTDSELDGNKKPSVINVLMTDGN